MLGIMLETSINIDSEEDGRDVRADYIDRR